MQTKTIWNLQSAQDLRGFLASPCSLARWGRTPPPGSAELFDSVLKDFHDCKFEVRPATVPETLLPLFPSHFWREPLAEAWAHDVELLCRAFCQEITADDCLMLLDCDRPCQRFHADNVLMRLVCTYRGPGTQWLNEDNLNRSAADTRGTHNHDIVLRPEETCQAKEWEVLVMKGRRSRGVPLYHKSPPPEPNDPKSLVLKFDLLDRWDGERPAVGVE